ncbi:MAG TPA: histidine kinase [Prolixibacteraceae bacterium]|nr:histidine kinase [Prolixibacteraceae bacterium]
MLKSISIPHNKITLSLHALAWIIVTIIPLYLNNAFGGGNLHRLYEFYLHTFSAAVIFYLGYLWLVPKYFLQDKKFTYVIIVIGLILATHYITNFIEESYLFDPIQDEKFREAMKSVTGKEENFRPPMKAFGFFNHFISSVLLSGFAIGLGVMEKLKQNEKKQKELEKEKLNSELAFLKNQISPHFFFNTLNNIYSLIGIDGPTAQDSVLKLSKLMRYLLYESEHGETMISSELDFMNNYIDLMKLRLSSRVELNIDFPKEFSDFSIPPLLFIPFIENAFKHGINSRDRSFINISMKIENDKISFNAENSIGKSSQTGDLQHSGIGLENVRKRLGLLFPDNHELKIEQNETIFHVQLSIQKKKSQV